jgi:hypothetical protein
MGRKWGTSTGNGGSSIGGGDEQNFGWLRKREEICRKMGEFRRKWGELGRRWRWADLWSASKNGGVPPEIRGARSVVEMGRLAVGVPEKGEIGRIWEKEVFEGKTKGKNFGGKGLKMRGVRVCQTKDFQNEGLKTQGVRVCQTKDFQNDFIFLIDCQGHARKGRT